jgi:hypothetical protein
MWRPAHGATSRPGPARPASGYGGALGRPGPSDDGPVDLDVRLEARDPAALVTVVERWEVLERDTLERDKEMPAPVTP